MKKIILLILVLGFVRVASAAQVSTSGTIVTLRNHTLLYGTPTLQGVSILQVSTPFTSGCAWVFIGANDKNALVVAVSAKLAGLPVTVYYDPTVTSPWGDPTTCGIVAIEMD
ncbi:MAG TPA: hypothetical protein VFA39_02625 [Steroidobacteraceae bacterium]|nr:hypothetical protein [Steroidobacteraceae bacterium]